MTVSALSKTPECLSVASKGNSAKFAEPEIGLGLIINHE